MKLAQCWRDFRCCVPTLAVLIYLGYLIGAKVVVAGVAADVLSRLIQKATRMGYVNGYG